MDWSLLMAAADVANSTSPSSSSTASSGTGLAQILLYFGGAAGLISAIVAILKLKPDANSQSVTQAQGAASTWQALYVEMKHERDDSDRLGEWWQSRALLAEDLLRQAGIPVPPVPARPTPNAGA